MEGEGEKTELASQTALVLAFPREGREGCLGAFSGQQAGPRGGSLGAPGSVIFQPARPASSFRVV